MELALCGQASTAQRKCGSCDGDPHHPSMAGFSVAELLQANPAIVSAEVLWVAPAIVVGWGIPTIAVAPAVAPTTTVVAPAAAVMTPAMAAPGHRWPGPHRCRRCPALRP